VSTEILYRRIQQGNRIRYEPVASEAETATAVTFTDAQCLSAAGALGVMLLIVFERMIPPHKRVARKIKAVQEAVLALYAGTGEPIDDEIATLMCATWDRVMKEISVDDPTVK